MAAFAPKFSISARLAALLVITVTACPFCTNAVANGLLMFPKEPVSIIFICSKFLILQSCAVSEQKI
ncbi:hypothetical protein D9M71_741410 [compost metagenome]